MTDPALNAPKVTFKHACPKCGSENLEHAKERQGFGFKKALVGGLALGPLGLLAGGINHGKTQIVITCLGCFHSFPASDLAVGERKLRVVQSEDEKKQRQKQMYLEAVRTPFRSACKVAVILGPICGLVAKIFSSRPYYELALMGIIAVFALFYLNYRSEFNKQLPDGDQK